MRRHRCTGWSLVWTIVSGACFVLSLSAAWADEPRAPFPIADRLDLWRAQRPEIRKTALRALGLSELFAHPEAFEVKLGRTIDMSSLVADKEGHLRREPGLVVEPSTVVVRSSPVLRFVAFVPPSVRPGEHFPAILFPVDEWAFRPENTDVDWANIEPALLAPALAERGYLVVVSVVRPLRAVPWLSPEKGPDGEPPWEETLRYDKLALDAMLSRKDVDPKRVGVAGVGRSGMRAWLLMALDERITCGVAAGGMTRLSDWRSANGQDRRPLAPWADALLKTFDTEAVMALCAPRRLLILSGDRDPLSPVTGFPVFRGTVGKVYGLYNEGRQFTPKVYEGNGGALTRAKWNLLVETFDKVFHPRGSTPQPQPSVKK